MAAQVSVSMFPVRNCGLTSAYRLFAAPSRKHWVQESSLVRALSGCASEPAA